MLENITPTELLFFAVVFIGFLMAIYFAEIAKEHTNE